MHNFLVLDEIHVRKDKVSGDRSKYRITMVASG
jgi:hypothetical protein